MEKIRVYAQVFLRKPGDVCDLHEHREFHANLIEYQNSHREFVDDILKILKEERSFRRKTIQPTFSAKIFNYDTQELLSAWRVSSCFGDSLIQQVGV